MERGSFRPKHRNWRGIYGLARENRRFDAAYRNPCLKEAAGQGLFFQGLLTEVFAGTGDVQFIKIGPAKGAYRSN